MSMCRAYNAGAGLEPCALYLRWVLRNGFFAFFLMCWWRRTLADSCSKSRADQAVNFIKAGILRQLVAVVFLSRLRRSCSHFSRDVCAEKSTALAIFHRSFYAQPTQGKMKSLSDRLYFLVAPPNLGGEKVTRALLFMPLLFFASLPCHAETQVSGLITNATWTATNSPYRVIGNIQVSGLMIQPGVQIIFQSNYVFAVNGILTASGTAANPIVFMGTNGGWQGIYFSNSAPGSVLAYCTVSNSVNSGIRILNTSPAINNCLITLNSSGSSIYGGGIYASIAAGDLTISNTTLANNTVPNVNPYKVSYGGGIYAAVNTNSLNLSGCIVTNNRANANYGYGWAYGGGVFVSGNGKFNSCLIRGNSCTARTEYNVTGGAAWGGGIFAQGGKFSLNNCLLELNTSSSPDTGVGDEYAYGGALYIQGGSSVVMSNCIVAGNVDSAPNGSAGGGICVAGGLFHHTGQYAPGGGSLNLVNCTIAYNNLEGLAIASGSTATVVNSIIYTNAAGDRKS